jgi:hypothetical protein
LQLEGPQARSCAIDSKLRGCDLVRLVEKRTLLNLSDWPHDRIARLRMLLKGGTVIPRTGPPP